MAQPARELTAARFIAPMQALGVDTVPVGEAGGWHGEIKFDGYRAIAIVRDGAVELWSRNHKPLAYPELQPALSALNCADAVLDGEIVALDAQGRSDFQVLQGRDLGERPPIVYYLFDLLHLNGRSLLQEPIEVRRTALQRLVPKPRRPLQLSRWFDVLPSALLAEARRHRLEGIVLKRRGSSYEPDRRSGAWLKIKNVNEQEFVIGGFTPPQHSRQYFGALLVGHFQGARLLYAGKVGTGFDAERLRALHARFQSLKSASCPFANLPLDRRSRFGPGMTDTAMRTVTWLKPKLVAQVQFAEWTQEGILRQPVFLGLRADKPPKQVRREPAKVA